MDSAWEGIFMLLVLKIPLVYLAAVVWWAIRAEPSAEEHGSDGGLVSLTPCGWDDWKRGRNGGRGGRPIRPNGQIPRRRAQRVRASV